jgi:hypothetical protein
VYVINGPALGVPPGNEHADIDNKPALKDKEINK